jgi:hypothetical protein
VKATLCYTLAGNRVADEDLNSLSERLLALTQKVEADEDVQALAKQVLALTGKVETMESRMVIVERLETQLEESALQTTRTLEEISRHWDAVVTALRRESERE